MLQVGKGSRRIAVCLVMCLALGVRSRVWYLYRVGDVLFVITFFASYTNESESPILTG